MKNRKTLAAAAALLLLCGCANNSPAKTSASASGTAAPAASVTEAAETTTGTTPPTQAAETAPETEKTLLLDFFGTKFYKEDGKFDEELSAYTFDYAPTSFSHGFYNDSDMNPGDFDVENYEYSGAKSDTELSEGTVSSAKAGDVIQEHEIADAHSTISCFEFDGETSVMFMSDSIDFKDDFELTGTIRLYYDEAYAISSGDMVFLPDSSYLGLPVGIGGDDTEITPYPDFFRISDPSSDIEKRGSGAAIYTDAQKFKLGNLFTDYADRSEIFTLLDGAKDNVSKKVKIVLSDVSVRWSDQFGNTHSYAKIKSIELA